MKKTLSHNLLIPLLLSFLMYLLFFFTVVTEKHTVFWGSDMKHKFYPVRVYLHNTILQEHRFPFWTEKIYSGFPIYADTENAYLHPLNILFTTLLDPILSYKALHIVMYLLGSCGLYLLLRNKGVGILGYIVSNTAFFFSYFFLNHQIHQSLIFTFYTFPLSLYLLDSYYTQHKHKFTVTNVIVTSLAFYWGHPQMMLLYGLGLLIYAIAFHASFKRLAYLILLGWFILLLSLPQLIPSLALNSNSVRSIDIENTSAEQGSFHPLMAVTLFYPRIFLDEANYQGKDINPEYSFVETYNYMGVTVVLLALLGLCFTKNKKIRHYLYYSFFAYMVLSFSKYIPILNLETLPAVNLFRYWTRSVVLLNFAVAIFLGFFINALFKKQVEFIGIRLKAILFSGFFIVLMILLNIKSDVSYLLLKTIPQNFIRGYDSKEWLAIILMITLLLAITILTYRKKPLLSKTLVVLMSILVIADLRYFSEELIKLRTDNIKDLERVAVPMAYNNKRILVEKGEIENNESLLYPFWWPLGYSQFKNKSYYDYFKSHSIDTISRPKSSNLGTEDYEIYRNIGVTHILFDDEVIQLNENQLDMIQNKLDGEYVYKKEGHIKFVTLTNEDQIIKTYIQSYPGWGLKINGKNVPLDDSEMFLAFDLPKGASIVELRYFPIHFYYGLLASFAGLTFSYVAYIIFRSRKIT